MKTVILANGKFPKTKKTLEILNSANRIICCDGATENLIKYGLKPNLIIGDLDSISQNIKFKYKNLIHQVKEQNTNDLTKAVNWCVDNNILEFDILGATGKREDHTIANISLLSKYAEHAKARIISDYGIFTAITQTSVFKSYKGQQVSIFAMNPESKITSTGLKYPLKNIKLPNWWNGTLNEAIAEKFSLNFEAGRYIVYMLY